MQSAAVSLAIDEEPLRDDTAAILRRAGFDVWVPPARPWFDDGGGIVVLSRGEAPELARETAGLSKTAAVVALISGTRAEAAAAIDAGARGVVCRGRLASTLPATIGAVLSGLLALPRDYRGLIAKPSLSFRERQILGMIVAEATVTEIAAELFLAPSTVKTHISSVLAKIGAQSRRQAVSIVLDPERGLGLSVIDPAHRRRRQEAKATA